MALLREFVTLDYDKALIKEAKEKGEPVVLKKALLQKCDEQNQNGRIYPRKILEREVSRYMDVVRDNRATGQADHPDSSVVELKDVSHIIRDIWWEGPAVWGTIQILDTPAGNIIQQLLSAGIRLGVSSRGIGETIKDEATGAEIVDESFQLICWDIVSEPSTRGAFIVSEGRGVQMTPTTTTNSKIHRVNSILDSILKKQ
jgi:hypothetical protein